MLNFKSFLSETKEIHLSHDQSNTTAKLTHEKDGLLFTSLNTPKEKRGLGGADHVINKAKEYADLHKKDIRLNAIAYEEDIEPKRLQGLYKKHGFEHQEGKPSFMMIRKHK